MNRKTITSIQEMFHIPKKEIENMDRFKVFKLLGIINEAKRRGLKISKEEMDIPIFFTEESVKDLLNKPQLNKGKILFGMSRIYFNFKGKGTND